MKVDVFSDWILKMRGLKECSASSANQNKTITCTKHVKKHRSSNFRWIEETMDMSCILFFYKCMFLKYLLRIQIECFLTNHNYLKHKFPIFHHVRWHRRDMIQFLLIYLSIWVRFLRICFKTNSLKWTEKIQLKVS